MHSGTVLSCRSPMFWKNTKYNTSGLQTFGSARNQLIYQIYVSDVMNWEIANPISTVEKNE